MADYVYRTVMQDIKQNIVLFGKRVVAKELSYADMILKYYSLDSDPKGDEDGDGVPNMDEVSFLGTNPTVKDTDENGINDGDEDDDEQ